MKSSQSALTEIKGTHKLLESLPAETTRLSGSAAAIAASSKEISAKLSLIPSESLTQASNAIVERAKLGSCGFRREDAIRIFKAD